MNTRAWRKHLGKAFLVGKPMQLIGCCVKQDGPLVGSRRALLIPSDFHQNVTLALSLHSLRYSLKIGTDSASQDSHNLELVKEIMAPMSVPENLRNLRNGILKKINLEITGALIVLNMSSTVYHHGDHHEPLGG